MEGARFGQGALVVNGFGNERPTCRFSPANIKGARSCQALAHPSLLPGCGCKDGPGRGGSWPRNEMRIQYLETNSFTGIGVKRRTSRQVGSTGALRLSRQTGESIVCWCAGGHYVQCCKMRGSDGCLNRTRQH